MARFLPIAILNVHILIPLNMPTQVAQVSSFNSNHTGGTSGNQIFYL